MEKYSNVKSSFIRTLLERTSWRERAYVDDLISLDGLIDCPHRGMGGAIHFHQLKRHYPSEYLLLLGERGEDQYSRGVEKTREWVAKERESHQRCLTTENLLHGDWLRAEGQP